MFESSNIIFQLATLYGLRKKFMAATLSYFL